MASMSGVPFCPRCSTLLELPDMNPIVCTACDFKTRFEDLGAMRIVTRSKPKANPSWAREVRDEASKANATHSKIDEPCPKCGHHELLFYTMQLRSADEGATVFYECEKCAHKFSQNN